MTMNTLKSLKGCEDSPWPNCVEFDAVTEGTSEIALSYWRDEESIRAWKRQAEHVIAQELGRERWYDSYTVQICEIRRQYQFPSGASE